MTKKVKIVKPGNTAKPAEGQTIEVYSLPKGGTYRYVGFTDEKKAEEARGRLGLNLQRYMTVILDPDLSGPMQVHMSAQVYEKDVCVGQLQGTFKDKKAAMLAAEASGLFTEEELAQMNNNTTIQLPENFYARKRSISYNCSEVLAL